jgi:tRNA1Val (adenine37-N6)-methyltransferase
MPNSYFEFKKFRIDQDQCAMKVCTDACTLGAWFAAKIPLLTTLLDIGSGTGLLMLMLAQKNEAEIHGIEMDLGAFRQLKENTSQSQWKERLRVFPGDARMFSFPVKYDFIICNPPFFEQELLSPSYPKNLAKHSLEFSFRDLLRIASLNLGIHGTLGILLPYTRTAYFEDLAKGFGFWALERLFIRQGPGHEYFRSILQLGKGKPRFIPASELIIQNEAGDYTDEFRELMKDYYLNLG